MWPKKKPPFKKRSPATLFKLASQSFPHKRTTNDGCMQCAVSFIPTKGHPVPSRNFTLPGWIRNGWTNETRWI